MFTRNKQARNATKTLFTKVKLKYVIPPSPVRFTTANQQYTKSKLYKAKFAI